MTDEDRYRYHAYNYGWHRVYQDRRRDRREPLDPAGDWFIEDMADRAERFFLRKIGEDAERKSPPPSGLIRENFRKDFSVRDWTRAEMDLANKELDEKAAAAGYPPGLWGRYEYVRSILKLRKNSLTKAVGSLMTERPPGRVLTPAEINAELGIPQAPEIPPPANPC